MDYQKENDGLLKEDNITVVGTEIKFGNKKVLIKDVESVYIGEQNPAKDRAFVYIAIGIVLIVFTTRWFMAGGVLAILAGIVTFFDSRRRYTLFIKTSDSENGVTRSYDLKRIKLLKKELEEKTAL